MGLFSNLRRRVMLTCEDVNAFLAAYLDGELDDRLHHRFEQHVANCPMCHTYFTQYEETIALVRAGEPTPTPPPELVDATLAFLRTHLSTTGPDDLSDRPDDGLPS